MKLSMIVVLNKIFQNILKIGLMSLEFFDGIIIFQDDR